jgi:serine protease inhibitor
MARTQLMSLADKARELAEQMEDDTQLEAWVESKITLAEDYIQTVHDYLKYNKKD